MRAFEFGANLEVLKTLSIGLLQIVGVVEVGLFIDMASKIIIGNDDGSCKVI